MSRRGRKETVGIALFPFLAVLICTMGALIVLLVLMVQQAKDDAGTVVAQQKAAQPVIPAGPSAAEIAQLQQAVEDARWRRETLIAQRTEKATELADQRLALSHLEDHIRRLEEQAKALLARAQEIDEGKQLRADQRAAALAELAKVKKEIQAKQKELDEAKKKQANQEKWYALIPYDGPNGTRRRPFYIECVEEGIVIQPEGLLLTPADFSGPLGPGNPLDAALRAKREFVNQSTGGKGGEPYPLLVVRPSGVVAYGAARAAMRAWDEEFGYELISEEKKLDFGVRDPNLDQMLTKTVSQARKRQAMLAAAMPRRYQDDEPIGSFSAQDSPGFNPQAASGPGFGGGGGGTGGMGTGNGNGNSGGLGNGSGGVAGLGKGSGSGTGMGTGSTGLAGGPGGPGGLNGTGKTPGSGGRFVGSGQGTGGGVNGGGPNGTGSIGQAAVGTGNGSPGGTASAGSMANNSGGGTAGGNAGGNSSGGTGGSGSGGASGGQSGQQANMPLPGGINLTAGSSPASGASGANSGSSQTGGSASEKPFGGRPPSGSQARSSNSGSPSSGSSGDSSSSASSSSAGGQRMAGSKAGSRVSGAHQESNWGLPDARMHQTGVTRPVRVVCQSDKLLILPEKGENRAPQVITLSPEMEAQQVQSFVRGVQKSMQGWGIAVSGGYWKPILQVEVAPDAEHRFEELQTALQNSGFDLKRKTR